MKLHRIEQNDFATYGILTDDDHREFGKTLELPWRDNHHTTSCVPSGAYTAERYFSPHHGFDVFRLIDVPGRDYVEIHIANLPRDIEGCIGLGSAFGVVDGAHGIVGSRTAFKAFMAQMHGIDRFSLTITDPPSTGVSP